MKCVIPGSDVKCDCFVLMTRNFSLRIFNFSSIINKLTVDFIKGKEIYPPKYYPLKIKVYLVSSYLLNLCSAKKVGYTVIFVVISYHSRCMYVCVLVNLLTLFVCIYLFFAFKLCSLELLNYTKAR